MVLCTTMGCAGEQHRREHHLASGNFRESASGKYLLLMAYQWGLQTAMNVDWLEVLRS